MSAICVIGTALPLRDGIARSPKKLIFARSSAAPRRSTSICLSRSRKYVTFVPDNELLRNAARSCDDTPSSRALFWSITRRLAVEHCFELRRLFERRGERAAFRKAQVHQQLRPRRRRKKLLWHEAEQAERTHEESERCDKHRRAMADAPRDQRTKPAVEPRAVDRFLVAEMRNARNGRRLVREPCPQARTPRRTPRFRGVGQHVVAEIRNH